MTLNDSNINSNTNHFETVELNNKSTASLIKALKQATYQGKKVYQIGTGEFAALSDKKAAKLDNKRELTANEINKFIQTIQKKEKFPLTYNYQNNSFRPDLKTKVYHYDAPTPEQLEKLKKLNIFYKNFQEVNGYLANKKATQSNNSASIKDSSEKTFKQKTSFKKIDFSELSRSVSKHLRESSQQAFRTKISLSKRFSKIRIRPLSSGNQTAVTKENEESTKLEGRLSFKKLPAIFHKSERYLKSRVPSTRKLNKSFSAVLSPVRLKEKKSHLSEANPQVAKELNPEIFKSEINHLKSNIEKNAKLLEVFKQPLESILSLETNEPSIKALKCLDKLTTSPEKLSTEDKEILFKEFDISEKDIKENIEGIIKKHQLPETVEKFKEKLDRSLKIDNLIVELMEVKYLGSGQNLEEIEKNLRIELGKEYLEGSLPTELETIHPFKTDPKFDLVDSLEHKSKLDDLYADLHNYSVGLFKNLHHQEITNKASKHATQLKDQYGNAYKGSGVNSKRQIEFCNNTSNAFALAILDHPSGAKKRILATLELMERAYQESDIQLGEALFGALNQTPVYNLLDEASKEKMKLYDRTLKTNKILQGDIPHIGHYGSILVNTREELSQINGRYKDATGQYFQELPEVLKGQNEPKEYGLLDENLEPASDLKDKSSLKTISECHQLLDEYNKNPVGPPPQFFSLDRKDKSKIQQSGNKVIIYQSNLKKNPAMSPMPKEPLFEKIGNVKLIMIEHQIKLQRQLDLQPKTGILGLITNREVIATDSEMDVLSKNIRNKG